MLIPHPRGTLSGRLFETLRRADVDRAALAGHEPDHDDDAAIALWTLHELHYRGFEDVDESRESAEWDPDLLRVRRMLEQRLEARLRERYAASQAGAGGGARAPYGGTDAFADGFFAYVAGHDGPSIAARVQRHADADQVLELMRWRSVYHLKEADPTAWVVPRLTTVPQAALMELVYDEYGTGDPNRLHHHLFARGMEAIGLRHDEGAYVDRAPLEVLEQNNTMSMLGLHRRLRGAALGHLAAFETTSAEPSRQMAQGLARLGFSATMCDYYLEHVEADAVHEQLAVRTICGSLLAAEPELTDDVFFGAFCCLDLEDRVAHRLLGQWSVAA